MDLFGPKRSTSPEQKESLKAAVRRRYGLLEEDTVTLIELRCSEPDCPPLETVVGVLREGGSLQVKIHKALADVTEADVQALPELGG